MGAPATPSDVRSGEILLYKAPDGSVQLEVQLQHETIWLTQKQMALLFDTERSVITKHLRNIFQSGELKKESVCAIFAHTAEDGKTYQTQYYNLDAIISVGYRVNSKRGTQFRIWATGVLRDHLIKGYTANARRLAELKQTIRLVSDITTRRTLTSEEATALLRVVRDYAMALDVLDAYDHGRLPEPTSTSEAAKPITLEEARRFIAALREHFGGSAFFGKERDGGLASSLAAVFQTAGGREVYPSLEEKAAHLLYFVVKNHPFVDGNKRIGAALFLRFLEKNGKLFLPDGTRRLSEEALVALTLLVAESNPKEKQSIVRLITFLLQERKEMSSLIG